MPSGNACPRCRNAPLFDGFLSLRPTCTACGLDYRFADAGDGPAVFIILGVGALIVFSALYVQIAYEPPIWVLLAVFMPLTLLVSLALLRPVKAAMIHRQYAQRAEEGRLDS